MTPLYYEIEMYGGFTSAQLIPISARLPLYIKSVATQHCSRGVIITTITLIRVKYAAVYVIHLLLHVNGGPYMHI